MNKDKLGLVMKYFVLKPDGNTPYHAASRQAILAYARCIADTNPSLANDLEQWIDELED